MAVLEMINRIAGAIDAKSHALGIFVDLAKAFDSVDHNILLKKLSHYGIRGLPLLLLQSYLTDRRQYVVYNNVNSIHCDVTYGIPEGSILEPLLFVLYVDDMGNCSSILNLILFADDTIIFIFNNYFFLATAGCCKMNVLCNIANQELHRLSL